MNMLYKHLNKHLCKYFPRENLIEKNRGSKQFLK